MDSCLRSTFVVACLGICVGCDYSRLKESDDGVAMVSVEVQVHRRDIEDFVDVEKVSQPGLISAVSIDGSGVHFGVGRGRMGNEVRFLVLSHEEGEAGDLYVRKRLRWGINQFEIALPDHTELLVALTADGSIGRMKMLWRLDEQLHGDENLFIYYDASEGRWGMDDGRRSGQAERRGKPAMSKR